VKGMPAQVAGDTTPMCTAQNRVFKNTCHQIIKCSMAIFAQVPLLPAGLVEHGFF
jgi:hypothetical protein